MLSYMPNILVCSFSYKVAGWLARFINILHLKTEMLLFNKQSKASFNQLITKLLSQISHSRYEL